MLNAGPEQAAQLPPEWGRLDAGVRRLLEELEGWRRRAVDAEGRASELQQMLHEVASGGMDPRALNDTVDVLQRENQELRRRLEEARRRVDGLLARMDFLAEEP